MNESALIVRVIFVIVPPKRRAAVLRHVGEDVRSTDPRMIQKKARMGHPATQAETLKAVDPYSKKLDSQFVQISLDISFMDWVSKNKAAEQAAAKVSKMAPNKPFQNAKPRSQYRVCWVMPSVRAATPMIAEEHKRNNTDFSRPLRSAASERSAVGSHFVNSEREPLIDLRMF